jgi:hypothetical protein
MELCNRWPQPEPSIPYGAGAKARDHFALATACFERLESTSDLAAYVGLKQMAHRSLEEAIRLLANSPSSGGTGGERRSL